jgi:hypothetical protein
MPIQLLGFLCPITEVSNYYPSLETKGIFRFGRELSVKLHGKYSR